MYVLVIGQIFYYSIQKKNYYLPKKLKKWQSADDGKNLLNGKKVYYFVVVLNGKTPWEICYRLARETLHGNLQNIGNNSQIRLFIWFKSVGKKSWNIVQPGEKFQYQHNLLAAVKEKIYWSINFANILLTNSINF